MTRQVIAARRDYLLARGKEKSDMRFPPCPQTLRIVMIACMALASGSGVSSGAVLDYAGTWSNLTFNDTGAAAAQFNTDAQPSVTFTLDLQGDVFGGPFGFPPVLPLTLTGMLNPDQSVTFDPVLDHPTYGYVIASFGSSGAVSIFSDPMPGPPGVFARTHIFGQRSLQVIDLQFNMQTHTGFFFGSVGSIDLTLIPEPSFAALIGLSVLATCSRFRPRSAHKECPLIMAR